MKLICTFVLAALCLVWAGVLVGTDGQPKFNLLPDPAASSFNHLGDSSPWASGGNGKLFASAGVVTNQVWPNLPTDKPLYAFKDKPSRPAFIPPGLYRSVPYTMLVLVPGPHLDDEIVRQPELSGMEKMPIIIPGLKLIPYSPNKP